MEPIDLSEILGRINRLKDTEAEAKLAAIKKYVSTDQVPAEALMKMAKLGTVIDTWMEQTEVTISAIQCWTSLEEFFGVVPCTVMSMMSENLTSSACEVDIVGVVGMHALQLASETPSALLDWNNNYGDDPDKAVCFHCSNLPKHFFKSVKMDFQQIIAGTVGRENTYGTLRRHREGQPDELCALLHQRSGRHHRWLCGRRRIHRRPAHDFRRRRRREDSEFAGAVEIYLRKRLRTPRRPPTCPTWRSAVQEATDHYLGWNVAIHE